MTPETALVLGLLLGAFSIPAIVSAWSDRTVPRASALTLLVALGLIGIGLRGLEPGFGLTDIPDVFLRVAADWLP